MPPKRGKRQDRMRSNVLAAERDHCAGSVVNILRGRWLSASAEHKAKCTSGMRLILAYLIRRPARFCNCRRSFGDMADVSGDLLGILIFSSYFWLLWCTNSDSDSQAR